MTSTEFVKYILDNDASIKVLVNGRIYNGLIKEDETHLPIINFFQIDAPNLQCNAERERFQISCRDATLESAKQLGFLVHCAFNNIQGAYNGFDVQNCYYDNSQFVAEEAALYAVHVDIFVFYVRT